MSESWTRRWERARRVLIVVIVGAFITTIVFPGNPVACGILAVMPKTRRYTSGSVSEQYKRCRLNDDIPISEEIRRRREWKEKDLETRADEIVAWAEEDPTNERVISDLCYTGSYLHHAGNNVRCEELLLLGIKLTKDNPDLRQEHLECKEWYVLHMEKTGRPFTVAEMRRELEAARAKK